MKMMHVASGPADGRIWTEPFRRGLAELGELEIIVNGAGLDESQLLAKLRTADVLLGAWGSLRLPEELSADPGKVRFLCCVTGGVRGFVTLAHIDAGLPVTNWGDQPAYTVAEGAMCLLLAALKGLHANIVSVRSGGGADTLHRGGGTLRGLRIYHRQRNKSSASHTN